MDRVTQQNSANAEESASASEEMYAQAEQMKEYVSGFRALVSGNANGDGKIRGKQSLPAPKEHLRIADDVQSCVK